VCIPPVVGIVIDRRNTFPVSISGRLRVGREDGNDNEHLHPTKVLVTESRMFELMNNIRERKGLWEMNEATSRHLFRQIRLFPGNRPTDRLAALYPNRHSHPKYLQPFISLYLTITFLHIRR
jgi:hypothetical protein